MSKRPIDRLYEYINYIEYSAFKFENEAGISNGYLSKQKERKGQIGSELLDKIHSSFENLNILWVISGDGQMLVEKTVPNTVPNTVPINKKREIENRAETAASEPAVEYKRPAVRIPLLPYDAVAGRGLGVFDDVKIERHYDVHEFRQADFLIYVKGSSMYPKYSSGDILACRLIKDRLFFQWNKTHVIYTDSQGVMVKRLCKSQKKDYIACHSDNKDYDPFEVPLRDIQDIAIVLGVIRLE